MARRALHLMVEQLQKQEEAAALEMAEAQQQLGEFQAQLDLLTQYRRGYLDQALSKGIDGLHSESFHQYQIFIQKLEQASTQQQQSINQLKQNVQHKRNQWLAVQAKRKAMQHLIEKQNQAEQKKQQQQEQKLLDEYALYAHLRGQTA